MKYLIIVEKTVTGHSAYSPDLPGVVAAGENRSEVEELMHQAIEFHIEGLKTEGQEIPEPSAYSTYLDVEAA